MIDFLILILCLAFAPFALYGILTATIVLLQVIMTIWFAISEVFE